MRFSTLHAVCVAATVTASAAAQQQQSQQQARDAVRVLPEPRSIFDARHLTSLDFGGQSSHESRNQHVFEAPDSANPSSSGEQLVAPPCPPSGKRTRKVAIIGAGPSGSSAAWFLGKAKDILEDPAYVSSKADGCHDELEITVFEKEERIGGRTAVVYPFDDPDKYEAVELGASIFADVNRNMVRAARYFNLTTGAKLGEEDAVTSIWDGQQFVFEDLGSGWWNSAKMLWRYGYGPITTKNLVKKLTDSFLKVYSPGWLHGSSSGYPWASISEFAEKMSFAELAGKTTLDHFYHDARIAKIFVEEVVEAATRVNYGQDVDQIHALGGGVSLAASGATGVVGGNYKLFEKMLGDSGARLRMGDHGQVTGIIKFTDVEDARSSGKVDAKLIDEAHWTQGTKWLVGTVTNFNELYDAVFIGTPWDHAQISLLNSDGYIPPVKYVNLHVTLLVTNATSPRGEYFGRGKDDPMPKTVLTTDVAVRKDAKHNRNAGTDKHLSLDFNSLNYIKNFGAPKGDGRAEDHLVKVFSAEPLTERKIDEILGTGTVSWVHRKEWFAYPYLRPRTEFPPLVVDERLFYINALEPLISTMETSTVSARNAVALLLKEWFGADFVHGGKGCEQAQNAKDGGWAGWGCRSG